MRWVGIIALVAIGLLASLHLLNQRAHKPRPASPDTLAGCPRVGGGYTHDGRWMVCYACLGETPVCLVIGGGE